MDELELDINYKAQYIYSIIYIIILDYDKIYDDLLKNAIKYGMSLKDFWEHSDYKIYFLYEEAYIERLHEEKHLQGLYNFIAFNTVISNALRDTKKGGKPLEYPQETIYHSHQKTLLKQKHNNKIEKQNVTSSNVGKALQQRLLECY